MQETEYNINAFLVTAEYRGPRGAGCECII